MYTWELKKVNNCKKCGAILIKRKISVGFSEVDGSKLYKTKVTCPNNSLFNKHYDETFDEDDKLTIYMSDCDGGV